MGKIKVICIQVYEMPFNVIIPSGQNIAIDCDSDATIADVKAQIFAMEEIKFNAQRLVFQGKVLENDVTIADLNIAEGSSIDLQINLQGGAASTMDPAIVELSKKYNHDKKICRKCYATLPPRALKCRKRSCGHWPDIRPRKALKGGK